MTVLLRCFAAFALAVAAVAACSPAPTAKQGGIVVADAWATATPPGAAVGVGYMTIRNQTSAAVRLMGGETPVAQRVEVHAMSMDGGVMRMRPANSGVEIIPGAAVELSPGGLHLMLIGLQRPLAVGERVPLTLVFDNGARVDAALDVRAMGGGHGH